MSAVPEEWNIFPEVWLDPFEVDQKLLTEFGVTATPFQNALDLARLEWSACTANDPPCLAGTIFWGSVVRYLRAELMNLGWTKDDSRNFSVVISPDGLKAIAVATGDDYTGTRQTTVFPRTKSAKGPATADAVAFNQLDLFPDTVDPSKPPMTTPGTVRTYWFLVRIANGEVFGELLLPMIMDEDRRIGRCKERIVLPNRDSEDGPSGARRRGPETGPDAEVTITRRAG
jgi:hypothetical protein